MDLLSWLKTEIPKRLDWLSIVQAYDEQDNHPLTQEEFLHTWVSWGVLQGFIKVFGTSQKPVGYLIARPVRMNWVFDTSVDYFKTLFQFDPAGEVVWIDSLWAPGFYDQVLVFLRSTQKPYVAWSHRNKLFFKVVRELSGDKPSKSEVEQGFVRHV